MRALLLLGALCALACAGEDSYGRYLREAPEFRTPAFGPGPLSWSGLVTPPVRGIRVGTFGVSP